MTQLLELNDDYLEVRDYIESYSCIPFKTTSGQRFYEHKIVLNLPMHIFPSKDLVKCEIELLEGKPYRRVTIYQESYSNKPFDFL